jgi:copper chaperone NosL
MKNRMANSIRGILLLCGLGLIVVLFVPLWTIDLVAPQYPEGLRLIINPNGLAGNVDIINGLNHYIGMKTLHNEDFIEFKILPYLIAFFAALFLLAAAIGKRKFLFFVMISYITFGVVAMVDFYKWEYDYGHNLNPEAAIIVPGMAYQPPLIGYKQLLNFSAYSFPGIGGWIFIGAGVLVILAVVLEVRNKKRSIKKMSAVKTIAAVLVAILFSSCSTGPVPIKYGTDNCQFCKMTISDKRYGAEFLTGKGKSYKFDDVHCVVEYLKENNDIKKEMSAVYFVDFNSGDLIPSGTAVLYHSESFKSPMNGNIAAFKSRESLAKVSSQYIGNDTSWEQVIK